MNNLDIPKKKFLKLNFNLKNEIFLFLKFPQIFLQVIKVNKSFSRAIKNLKVYGFLKNNIDAILTEIFYDFEELENFKKKYSEDIALTKDIFDELIKYLLLKKYNRFSFFYLKDDKNLFCYLDFLKFSNNINKIILKNEQFGYENEDHHSTMNILKEVLNYNIINLHTLQFCSHFFDNQNQKMKLFKKMIIKNNKINTLIILGNDFSENLNDFEILRKILLKNKYITNLQLINNDLSCNKACVEILVDIFSKNKTITHLNLFNNKLGKYIDKIGEMVANNTSLTHLNFGENKIEKYGRIEYFKNMLINNKSLISVDLEAMYSTITDPENFSELKEAFVKNKKLKHLGFASQFLCKEDKSYEILLEIINNSGITSIDLSSNIIVTSELNYCFTSLKDSLLDANRIISLNLNFCDIGSDEGLTFLKELLVNDKTLKQIFLRRTRLKDNNETYKIIKRIIKKNTTLEYMDISLNKFVQNNIFVEKIKKSLIQKKLKIIYNNLLDNIILI